MRVILWYLMVTTPMLVTSLGALADEPPYLAYDPSRPLLTLHGNDASERPGQYAMTDFDQVVDQLLRNDSSGKPRPFILYIHGRGDEPQKSFGNTKAYGLTFGLFGSGFILEKVESEDVSVMGVDWASKAQDVRCGRPKQEAEQAGPVVIDVLAKLAAHRAAHPERWQGRRTMLLVHSLGSYVLKSAMARPETGASIRQLFDIRLITGSDAIAGGHDKWIPAGQPGNTVVVSNAQDKVLTRSMSCKDEDKGHLRLGKLPASDTIVARAPGVTYLEVDAKKSHRTFTRGGAAGNPNACATIESLMHGTMPALDDTWRSKNANSFRIPFKPIIRKGCKADEGEKDGDD
jgi:hypothetical protein